MNHFTNCKLGGTGSDVNAGSKFTHWALEMTAVFSQIDVARHARRCLLALAMVLAPASAAWASVSYVASSAPALANGNVNSILINYPAGLAAGDLMVAFLSQRGGSFPIGSTAAGWTNALYKDNGSMVGVIVYYKFATAADVSAGSFTFSFTASNRSAGAIMAFRGVDTTSPINVSGSQSNASSASMTAPSITTTVSNTMLVGLYTSIVGGNTATPPGGMTEAFDSATGAGPNGVAIEGAYVSQAAVGATATQVATAASATANIGVLLALAAAGPDHYELSLPTASVNCLATPVIVSACANGTSPCTSLYAAASGSSATLATTGGILGATSVIFNSSGVATTTLSYPAAADSTAVSVTLSGVAASNSSKCCPDGVSCSVASSCATTFKTSGFIFSSTTGGAAATIASQIAGTVSSQYYLRAVKTNTTTQACESALSAGASSVNLGYNCNNPTTCSTGNYLDITPAAQATQAVAAGGTALNLYFDANGNAPFTFNYRDVGQITLAASKAASGSLLSALAGTSNAFVVKPGGLVISGIKQTASPYLVNPAAADQTGAVFVKAGESFTATVTATTSAGAVTPNYGQETAPFAESVLLTQSLVLPSGGSGGTLSNYTVSGFTNGAATATNLAWSEVGIITLTASVGDGDYLGAGDFTGTTTGNVGRFYPAQFAISGATLTNACTAGTAFTYFGEDGFTTAFTLTAQNLSGVTTTNYNGVFAKLDLTTYANYGFTAAPLPAGSNLSSSATAPSGTWANGVATVSARHQISRPTAITGETSITVSAAPSDGEVPAALPATSLGSATLRYGRLQLLNAYGSELLALPVPLRAQYWNGIAWVTNADDSCTSITAPTSGAGLTFYPEVAAGVMGNHLSAAETAASVNASGKLVSGSAGLKFSKPGSGNSGYVDISIPLASKPWVQFPWGGGGNVNPSGRATFGIYKSRLIYSRENY
jgi:MSHA biogenesis protein MshQ